MLLGFTDSEFEYYYGREQKYRKMRELGFGGADFQAFVPDNSPVFTMSETELADYLKEEKRLADEAGVFIHQVHGPWRYPPRDATPEDLADRRWHMERSIRGTAMLGSKVWVIHPIMPFGMGGKGDADELMEQNVAFFKPLIALAEKVGVTVCFENMPSASFPLARCANLLELIERVGGGEIVLDTGHAATYGISPADEVRTCGKKLRALHIHDNDGRSDFHYFPYNNRGTIDWAAFRDALRENGYTGVISLECSVGNKYPPVAAEYIFRALAEVARSLTV